MSWFPASSREEVAAGALTCGAVVFAGFGVARLLGGASVEVLTLPFALLAADLLIATALITGWYPVRPVAQGLAIFGALVHLLVALRSGALWMRGWSGLIAVLHVYSLLLLFAISAREQYEDELDDDDFDDDLATKPETRAEPAASAPEGTPPRVDGPAVADEPEVRESHVEEPTADETADQQSKAAERPVEALEAESRSAERAAVEESPAEEAEAESRSAQRPSTEESPAEHTEAAKPPAEQLESPELAAEDVRLEPPEAVEAQPTEAVPAKAELAGRRAEQFVEQETVERPADDQAPTSNGKSVTGQDWLATAALDTSSGQSVVGAGRVGQAERRKEEP